MQRKWKERGQAAAWHLLASLAAAFVAAILVFVVWFPHPYEEVSGGAGLFRIIVSVDVALGPLLTLVVFDRAKPTITLWRDLSIIVLLQFGALGYGLHTVYLARPVYLVHEVDRFVVVTASMIDPEDLPQAPLAFRELPRYGIRMIGVRPSHSGGETLESITSALAGKDISLMPKRWQELDDANRTQIRRIARDAGFLRTRAKDGGKALDQLLAESGVPPEHVIALPMMGRRDDWSVVMDRRDLRILGYLPIDAF